MNLFKKKFSIVEVLRILRSKTPLRVNIFSNFLGNALNAVLGILLVPVYVNRLGVASYGLIGIFSSIQAILWTLDLGLSTTLNREVARLSVDENDFNQLRHTVRTIEIASWTISILITVILLVLSPLIAVYWVESNQIENSTITQSFLLMSLTFGFQLPLGMYSNGLAGLQRQVLLNIINIICAILRYLGAFLIITLVSSTIQAFLGWQLLISILQTFSVAFCLWKISPEGSEKAKFNYNIIEQIFRFSISIAGASSFSLIMMQADKIILSKMTTLESFGYYTLATMVATLSLGMVNSSISSTVYPQLSQAVSAGNYENLKKLYHKCSQIMSVLALPITVYLATFSSEILHLWLRNGEVADNTSPLLTLLITGTGISLLKSVPYNTQLAYGWTRLNFYGNLAGVFILIPTLFFGAYYGDMIGVAIGLLIYRTLDTFVITIIMHRRILKGEFLDWLFNDILTPLFFCSVVIGAGKIFLLFVELNPFVKFFVLGFIFLAAIAAAVYGARLAREWIAAKFKLKGFPGIKILDN